MAKNQIKGINIEIGGNTAPLDKALGEVNSKTSKLQSELREVERLLKLDPTNTELLAQKQKILGDSIENAGDKLIALKDAEKQVQEQFKKGEVSEEQYRALQREIVKTEQDLKKVEDQANETNKALSSDKAIGNLKNIGKAAGVAALAIGATAVGLGAAAINSADELQKLSDQTGLSAERLQELQYAGNNLGVELETITGAQAKLTKSMASAKDGTGAQAEAFETLGVKIRDDVTGELRDSKVVMEEAFTALNGVGNETERDALAMQIFGKSAMELNPLIKAGGDELNRLATEAQNNGAVMSDEAVAGLDAFGDTMDNLKTSILGSFGEALSKILPDIQAFINKLIELPNWIKENSTLLTIIGIALGTLTVAIVAYNVAAGWAAITTGIMTTATAAFGAVLAFVTSPITLIILAIGALIAIGVLLYKNFDEIKVWCAEAWTAITTSISTAVDSIKDVVSKIIDFFVELPGKIWEQLVNVVTKMEEWGENVLNWIKTEVPKFIANIIIFYVRLPIEIANELAKVVTAIIEWVGNMISTVGDEFPALISKILGFFTGLPSKMLDVGGDMVKGIWEGIKNMTEWLEEKVFGFVGGIVDGIKGALKINSPSELLADEVGTYMAQGIGVGFENEMTSVSNNMAKAIPTGGKDYVGSASSGSNVNHTGTIRVEGVNNKGDLMATVDIVMSQLRRELRTT